MAQVNIDKTFHPLLKGWLKDYSLKPESENDEVWLAKRLAKDLPELSEQERGRVASEMVTAIALYNSKREALRTAESRGMSREGWLARELKNSAHGMNVIEYGNYLSGIDTAIAEANQDLARTVFTKSGEINNNPNLYGFIAEAEHAATYNMDAALKNEGSRAQVLRPEPGTGYAKNSPDIVIQDKHGNTDQLVQSKYYSDKEASNIAHEKGNYEGQERLVPEGHAKDGVSQDRLSHDGVESKPLSVDEAKEKQRKAQQEGDIPEKSWNDYTTTELALNMGKQAAWAGLQGAALGAAGEVINGYLEDGKVDGEAVAETAIKGGAKSGATCAVAGALKIYVEKNKLPPLPTTVSLPFPKRLPPIMGSPVVIGMIASSTIDAICTAYKVAKGEMTVQEGLLETERSAFSVVTGTWASMQGASVGAAIGAVLGPIGAAVGGFVGGTVAYIAGSTVGRTVAAGVQKVREGAVRVVKRVASAAVGVAKKAWSGFKSVVSSLLRW